MRIAALRVDHGNQIFRILTDEAVHLVALTELAADALNQELLVDGVQVEQEHESNEAAYGLAKVERKVRIGLLEKIGEGGHARGQQ